MAALRPRRSQTPDKPEARREALAEALGRALCCDLSRWRSPACSAPTACARARRALEALAGFALHTGLRERFDADWFRNPRSAELLRDACMSGNRLTPEALCAELVACRSTAADPRARCELVAADGSARRFLPLTGPGRARPDCAA